MIARALEQQGLYDPEDGFFYDRLVLADGSTRQVKVQTIGGVLPVLPAVGLPERATAAAARLGKRFARLRQAYADTGGTTHRQRPPARRARRGNPPLRRRPRRAPAHAAAAVRRVRVPLAARAARALEALREQPLHSSKESTAPGSTTSRRSRRRACSAATRTGAARSGCRSTTSSSASSSSTTASSASPSRSSTRPVPGRSGRSARSRRTSPTGCVSIWLPGDDGRRPVYGGTELLQSDPAWKDNLAFFEYFHGDNGAGLGAMHQTGWTALVADLILDPPSSGLERLVPPTPTAEEGARDNGRRRK